MSKGKKTQRSQANVTGRREGARRKKKVGWEKSSFRVGSPLYTYERENQLIIAEPGEACPLSRVAAVSPLTVDHAGTSFTRTPSICCLLHDHSQGAPARYPINGVVILPLGGQKNAGLHWTTCLDRPCSSARCGDRDATFRTKLVCWDLPITITNFLCCVCVAESQESVVSEMGRKGAISAPTGQEFLD